jgi:hypothetical protein
VIVQLRFRPLHSSAEGIDQGVTDVLLIRPGMAFRSPDRTLEGGVAENMWVSVLFIDGMGRPIDGEQVVGRCVPA